LSNEQVIFVPRLEIDQRAVEVAADATIVDAAAQLGIEIPTLCFSRECTPSTSCLVCLVKLRPSGKIVPACATKVADGMVVESETAEVHNLRRNALELLLSDHLGDCVAPCSIGCPAEMNIPQMLRQIAAGELHDAIITIKADIALPAVLGRICPAPCENACRRKSLDESVGICELKRIAADADLATSDPYRPTCKASSGKRVAVIGGGPAGLAAAYHLAQDGHACTIFDENERLGGMLHTAELKDKLPLEVLQAEIDQILRLGVETRLGVRLGRDISLAELREQFDAVLLAIGSSAATQAPTWQVKVAGKGIAVTKRTYQTNVAGVFAVGNAIRGQGTTAIRSVGEGKEGAAAVDQFLAGHNVAGYPASFTTRIGKMEPVELVQLAFATGHEAADAIETIANEDAAAQAERCLHCDCRALTSCKLRHYSAVYNADPRRFKSERRRYEVDVHHPDVIFEPGKCIDCGLCVQISSAAGEPIGMAFIGRGYDVRVGVPLGHTLADALQYSAAECIAACPTAALAWKTDAPCSFHVPSGPAVTHQN